MPSTYMITTLYSRLWEQGMGQLSLSQGAVSANGERFEAALRAVGQPESRGWRGMATA